MITWDGETEEASGSRRRNRRKVWWQSSPLAFGRDLTDLAIVVNLRSLVVSKHLGRHVPPIHRAAWPAVDQCLLVLIR